MPFYCLFGQDNFWTGISGYSNHVSLLVSGWETGLFSAVEFHFPLSLFVEPTNWPKTDFTATKKYSWKPHPYLRSTKASCIPRYMHEFKRCFFEGHIQVSHKLWSLNGLPARLFFGTKWRISGEQIAFPSFSKSKVPQAISSDWTHSLKRSSVEPILVQKTRCGGTFECYKANLRPGEQWAPLSRARERLTS